MVNPTAPSRIYLWVNSFKPSQLLSKLLVLVYWSLIELFRGSQLIIRQFFLGRIHHTMSVLNKNTLVVCGGLYTTHTCISWSKDSPDNVWQFFASLRYIFQLKLCSFSLLPSEIFVPLRPCCSPTKFFSFHFCLQHTKTAGCQLLQHGKDIDHGWTR